MRENNDFPNTEDGWVREDDTNKNITYSEEFVMSPPSEKNYMETEHNAHNAPGATIKFNFTGEWLRLINRLHPNRCDDIDIFIDNINSGKVKQYNIEDVPFGISFEKLNLENKEHCVKIINNSEEGFFVMDAIDVEEGNSIKKYNENVVESFFLIIQNKEVFSIKDEYLNQELNEYMSIKELNPNKLTVSDFEKYGFKNLSDFEKAIQENKIKNLKNTTLIECIGEKIKIHSIYKSTNNIDLSRNIMIQNFINYDTKRKIESRVSYVLPSDTKRKIIRKDNFTFDTTRKIKINIKKHIDTFRKIIKNFNIIKSIDTKRTVVIKDKNTCFCDTSRKVIEEDVENWLCSLEELKKWLEIDSEDISQDLILQMYIDGATDMIMGMIGRDIQAKDRIEKYAGTDTNSLVLKHFPINEVYKVEYIIDNSSVGKVENYDVNSKSGILYKDLAWWVRGGSHLMSGNLTYPRRHIRVSYNAGYKKVPSDLKLLTLQLIANQIGLDKSEATSKGLKKFTISDVTWEWKNENKLTESQMAIINKYRVFNI